MKLSKLFVIAFNILLLVLSIVMISSASTPKYILGNFYGILTTGNNIYELNVTWLASGFILLTMGIFGLWSTLKESIPMLNLYTVILSLTLILQIVTGTTANQLSSELEQIVSRSMKNLMTQYGHDAELTSIMDSIQKEFRCCGYNGPSDWQKSFIAITEQTLSDKVENSFYEFHDDYRIMEQKENPFRKFTPPTSCCKSKCRDYYSDGCFYPLYNDIARVVYMVKSVAMISSVLQIFGLCAAYMFGRTLRGRNNSCEPNT